MNEDRYCLTFMVWFLLGFFLLIFSLFSIFDVSAKELDIINSSKLNKGLDLGTGSYFDTLIQDNIVNATCDWSGFGCAIQVPISPTQQMISNQNYKISILVSVASGIKIVQPKFSKNLAFSKLENDNKTVSLWRLWNYSLPNNFVYNADIEISLQSSANNIDIYRVDYIFKSNSLFDFDVVALAFALNTSNSTQTGTIKFSYLMLDATNQEIVDAVKDLNDSLNSDSEDTSSSKCGVICKLKGIFTGITELPGKIANLIKGLFVPDNFDFINDFKDVMIEKLGILGQVPDMLLTLLNDILNKEYTNQCFKMPKMEFWGYSFWNEMNFCIQDSFYYKIIKDYRWMTNIVPVFGVLFYSYRTYKKFFGESDTA